MLLPFQTVTTDKFEVRRCVEEAAIIVSSEAEPATSCTVTLTSPIMRESGSSEGGKGFDTYLYIFQRRKGITIS